MLRSNEVNEISENQKKEKAICVKLNQFIEDTKKNQFVIMENLKTLETLHQKMETLEVSVLALQGMLSKIEKRFQILCEEATAIH